MCFSIWDEESSRPVDRIVEVQLERIGTRLLEQGRIGQPPVHADTVQGRDDRNRHGCLDFPNLLDVFVWSQGKFLRHMEFRAVRGRPGQRVIQMREPTRNDLGDLFFEQRVHTDGRAAPVFEPPDVVEVPGERRRTKDEGMRQLQPQIRSRQRRLRGTYCHTLLHSLCLALRPNASSSACIGTQWLPGVAMPSHREHLGSQAFEGFPQGE